MFEMFLQHAEKAMTYARYIVGRSNSGESNCAFMHSMSDDLAVGFTVIVCKADQADKNCLIYSMLAFVPNNTKLGNVHSGSID